MNAIPVFFCDEMLADSDSRSPSAGKPGPVVAAWECGGLATERRPIGPATLEELSLAHDPEFVRAVLAGEEANGFGNRREDEECDQPISSMTDFVRVHQEDAMSNRVSDIGRTISHHPLGENMRAWARGINAVFAFLAVSYFIKLVMADEVDSQDFRDSIAALILVIPYTCNWLALENDSSAKLVRVAFWLNIAVVLLMLLPTIAAVSQSVWVLFAFAFVTLPFTMALWAFKRRPSVVHA